MLFDVLNATDPRGARKQTTFRGEFCVGAGCDRSSRSLGALQLRFGLQAKCTPLIKRMHKSKFTIGAHRLTVRRSRTGRGLFSSRPIKKGTRLVEYTGRLLSDAECYTSRSKYLFAINDEKMIDGWVKGNTARYINHSCRPNCEIEIRGGRIYVMAARPIKADEELTFDYGDEYFEDRIRPQGCKCVACFPLAAVANGTSRQGGR